MSDVALVNRLPFDVVSQESESDYDSPVDENCECKQGQQEEWKRKRLSCTPSRVSNRPSGVATLPRHDCAYRRTLPSIPNTRMSRLGPTSSRLRDNKALLTLPTLAA